MKLYHRLLNRRFADSARYWERRYRGGGDSGPGSSGRLADFKAHVVNDLIRTHGIRSVIEWGCGDGRQLSLLDVKTYVGVDISEAALTQCRRRFSNDSSRAFLHYDEALAQRHDMALSLDVIYHLTEDSVYDDYLRRLFASASRFVVIYSSDLDAPGPPHIRHRRFSEWVAINEPGWRLTTKIPNPYPLTAGRDDTTFADFYIYVR